MRYSKAAGIPLLKKLCRARAVVPNICGSCFSRSEYHAAKAEGFMLEVLVASLTVLHHHIQKGTQQEQISKRFG